MTANEAAKPWPAAELLKIVGLLDPVRVAVTNAGVKKFRLRPSPLPKTPYGCSGDRLMTFVNRLGNGMPDVSVQDARL